ncbi:hypothetical protein P691DRAFT_775411 [Macrolepiota fuliginosa MF-IS2]|uniref:Uncharacterized protein n=1 Tax=Macrolepiota fuliginosa MF-IS2 TaxID=1400762 RepID=A0A9P5XEM8_9AGAR|nr:hypothetical protein P691DRAFT_775411 [Macrolepiota fuliginosa MF-IS2]
MNPRISSEYGPHTVHKNNATIAVSLDEEGISTLYCKPFGVASPVNTGIFIWYVVKVVSANDLACATVANPFVFHPSMPGPIHTSAIYTNTPLVIYPSGFVLPQPAFTASEVSIPAVAYLEPFGSPFSLAGLRRSLLNAKERVYCLIARLPPFQSPPSQPPAALWFFSPVWALYGLWYALLMVLCPHEPKSKNHIPLFTNDNAPAEIPLGKTLVHNHYISLVVIFALFAAVSRMHLRKYKACNEVLSHCVLSTLTMPHPHSWKFHSSLGYAFDQMVWGFATIAVPRKDRPVITSRAGGWTNKGIAEPPFEIWVRGAPAWDMTSVACLFRKVLFVRTGPGIAPTHL